jgi:hypothetical protein
MGRGIATSIQQLQGLYNITPRTDYLPGPILDRKFLTSVSAVSRASNTRPSFCTKTRDLMWGGTSASGAASPTPLLASCRSNEPQNTPLAIPIAHRECAIYCSNELVGATQRPGSIHVRHALETHPSATPWTPSQSLPSRCRWRRQRSSRMPKAISSRVVKWRILHMVAACIPRRL